MSRTALLCCLCHLACGPRHPSAGPEPEPEPATPAPEAARERPAAADPVPAPMKPLLEAHNQRRARHCAPPLAWSAELARVAEKWADGLARRGCAFDHSGGVYGENLAGGTTGTLDGEHVTAMWYGEGKRYDFRGGGFSMDTGHFTQLVWKGTERVGCGTATCKGLDLWVCNYDPPGNVDGEYRQNVLPTSCRR